MTAVVYVLNGASFAAAGPNRLTVDAAAVLQAAGDRAVQVTYPSVTARSFEALAARLVRASHGQRVGLVGFSAGGNLALRLAATPGLNVGAVLDYYGVPDVRAFLQEHAGDHFYRPIGRLAPFRNAVVSLLSGPVATQAVVIGAFGQNDPNVRADASAADLLADDPSAHVYKYAGGHGASITASRPALEDFLAHL